MNELSQLNLVAYEGDLIEPSDNGNILLEHDIKYKTMTMIIQGLSCEMPMLENLVNNFISILIIGSLIF